MKNTWRLTTDLLAMFFNGQSTKTGEIFKDVVAFCPVEKKSFKNSLTKLMGGVSFTETTIVNNNFHIRVNSSGNIEIRSDQFPDPTKYYMICSHNIFGDRLSKEVGYLISNLTNDKGDFSGYDFEVAFSNNDSLSIKFICKELEIYNSCLNELNRRTKCELFKKTKTFIPGHRYDSLDESIIYLGKFKSSKSINKDSSISITDNVLDYKDVYLFIDADEISENEKSIKDIFNNRYFSEADTRGIKEIRKLKSMVDSGEVLVNDIDSSFSLKDYHLNLVNNLISNILDSTIKVPISNEDEIELITYKQDRDFMIKDILSPLMYFSENKYGNIEDNVKNIVKTHLTNVIRLSIFEALNLNIVNNSLLTNPTSSSIREIESILIYKFLSPEWKIESLINFLFINNFYDSISGTSLDDTIIRQEIVTCNNIMNNFSSIDFENYCKSISRLLHENYYSRQRENTCSYYKLDIITIESLFGKSQFTETLKTICREAIDTSGNNVDFFVIKNLGTRKSPSYYISMCISLNNIINYFNGINNIPDEIISTIKLSRFNSLNIDIDLDIKDIK